MNELIHSFAIDVMDGLNTLPESEYDFKKFIKTVHDSAGFLCLQDVMAICSIILETGQDERINLLKELLFKLERIKLTEEKAS